MSHRLGSEPKLESTYVWLGQAEAATPMHYDNHHNVYVMIVGSKTFHLLPPEWHLKVGGLANKRLETGDRWSRTEERLWSDLVTTVTVLTSI